ncbi:hypothetical protein T484DRAFT_3515577 [Baffinella frigidus]|nr:hypothetical protein T484DRAFT_3515577 [Cryptophyta sp. CCMP2293]
MSSAGGSHSKSITHITPPTTTTHTHTNRPLGNKRTNTHTYTHTHTHTHTHAHMHTHAHTKHTKQNKPHNKATRSLSHTNTQKTPAAGRHAYGLWFMVYGLWFMVHGLWFMLYGLWFMVYGLWLMVFRIYDYRRAATVPRAPRGPLLPQDSHRRETPHPPRQGDEETRPNPYFLCSYFFRVRRASGGVRSRSRRAVLHLALSQLAHSQPRAWRRVLFAGGRARGLVRGLDRGLVRGLDRGLVRGLDRGLDRGLVRGRVRFPVRDSSQGEVARSRGLTRHGLRRS